MKNKLLLCFRPLCIETETKPGGANSSGDRSFVLLTVDPANNNISAVKSPVSAIERSECSEKNEIHTRKRETSKFFPGVVKAALFEFLLRKKSRNRKPCQLMTTGSSITDSRKSDDASSDVLESPDTNSQSIRRSDSSTSSSSTSSSSSSSSSHSSLTLVKELSNDRATGSPSSHSGLFLILLSLAITILYGRSCAVIFTSLCLMFLSRRRICRQLPPEKIARSAPEETEASARDNRKKVIMEGWIERNHRRGGHSILGVKDNFISTV
ncbi:hypothetical protein U1Q18_001414 [Sarracenia purpurea var. burkii]